MTDVPAAGGDIHQGCSRRRRKGASNSLKAAQKLLALFYGGLFGAVVLAMLWHNHDPLGSCGK
jgi:hypothetical protein